MNWENLKDFIDGLPERHRDLLHLVVNEEILEYGIEEKVFRMSRADFENQYGEDYSFDDAELVLFNNKVCEVLVDMRNSRFSPGFAGNLYETVCQDHELKVSYQIKEPSLPMIVNLFQAAKSSNLSFRISSIIASPRRGHYSIEDTNITFAQFLAWSYRLPDCVHIEAESNKNLSQLKQLSNSFIFNISYNLGFTLKTIGNIEEVCPRLTRHRARRVNRIEDIEPPKRYYIPEISSQYFMARASRDPFIEFLCYYHVMEYFFDEVYKEDIIKNVQDLITSPKFSAKRQKDVVTLVERIQKKTLATKQEYQINEQEALALTLKKYIPNLDDIRDDLNEIDSSLVMYYRTHQVSFSKGDEIDLTNIANDKLHSKIAARIYKTRNSIVHSKSNDFRSKDRGIYRPFKDEKELSLEIPLMQLLAESIIIGSSKII